VVKRLWGFTKVRYRGIGQEHRPSVHRLCAGEAWLRERWVSDDQERRYLRTDAGNPIVVARESTAQLQLAAAERMEFNAKYLDRAVALRDQLSVRLGGTPDLKSFPSGRLIAFTGYLKAPSAVTYAADYLEALVSLLPPATPGH
jgi:hypothetical protein